MAAVIVGMPLDGLNHLLKASSKAVVEKCLNLVFVCRSEPSSVSSFGALFQHRSILISLMFTHYPMLVLRRILYVYDNVYNLLIII